VWQAFPEFSLIVVSSCMQCGLVNVVHKFELLNTFKGFVCCLHAVVFSLHSVKRHNIQYTWFSGTYQSINEDLQIQNAQNDLVQLM
jgi:hypothetical protein